MKFTSHVIVKTRNCDCYMLYGKGTEPNKGRLDIHITESESYVGQIIKGYGCERDRKYIKKNLGDSNAAILHFRTDVQSDCNV